jgi:hypothetical protein
MANITRIGFVTVLTVALFAGCSKSTPSNTSTSAAADGGDAAAQTDFSNNPIAQVASEFLDAVLKGDTQRGTSRLTPKAIEQIVAGGKKFDPPGVDNPSFRVVGVASPTTDHAFVQCEFNYTSQGVAHNEDMCCELRLVNNEWRVSGIAYGTSPDKPWILTDFETGRDIPIIRQAPADATAGTAGPDGSATRPSPPRTAQETPAASLPAERR